MSSSASATDLPIEYEGIEQRGDQLFCTLLGAIQIEDRSRITTRKTRKDSADKRPYVTVSRYVPKTDFQAVSSTVRTADIR